MSGPPVTLIGNPVSPYVRKILAICAVKGIEVAIDPITPFRGDETFSKISPLRRIPVWIEGDLTLCDSSIIAQYIEDTQPTPSVLPTDPGDRARARWIEEYADTRLFDVLGWKLFFQVAIKPRILKEETDPALVEKARTVEIPETFDYLETVMPETGFLFGDAAGLADYSLAPAFLNARVVGVEVDAARWPKLAGWLGRVESETPLKKLNDVAMAFMTTRLADQPGVLAEHGYVLAERSHDGGRAMRGPMSPV
ncbi:glutathione S-transferase family protein [Brevundimonas sp.]|uniref:glutathione S-transferase family protein n=1 Tax=Brevundimonas sp. TaxID=1871086 RepID=UPI00286C19E2|nr:glutathione S-transferase family protein [Brevundimonas sp.]